MALDLCYRKLHRYKYQLIEPFSLFISIKTHYAVTEYILLHTDGKLTIRSGYAWDGPSGPTIDTKNFMRGALIHDALYQLIRMTHLPPKYRRIADDILYELCRKDGMSRFRAWYIKKAINWFGKASAIPGDYRNEDKAIRLKYK